MIKSSTASTTKSPSTQLPAKSAWAKGPPRSQSPAPNNPNSNANANAVPSQPSHQTHSRRPSALGGAVPIKDGVSVPRGNLGAAKQGGAINFGSVNEQQSAPTSSSPPIKSESRHVQSFGTISAQQPHSNTSNSTVNGKLTNGTNSSISSTSSTNSVSSSMTSISASSPTPSKPNFDVKSLFRGSGTPAPSAPQTASSISSSYADNFKVSSPPIRSAGLPPHGHPSHPSQQHTPNGAPHQPQPLTPHFGNFGGPRQGGGPAGGAGGGNHPQPPRSPSYPRQMSNGMNGPGAANGARPPPTSNNNIPGGGPVGAGGPAGPTPPNSNTNVTNANAMPSPRLGPPQHHQHPGHPQQHQHAQMQPMHGQHMQGVPGMQGMQGMQMPGVGVNVPPPMSIQGWPAGPYYPQYYTISEHYLAQGYPPPPQWQGYHPQQQHQQHHPQHPQHHPLQLPHQSPAPSTPHAHVHGLPVSPRQPPPPLQAPGTPPAGGNALSINTGGLTSPPPSARLNSGASTFVPGHGVRQSKVVIKDSQGQEIDLSGLSKKGVNTGSPVVEKVGFLSERAGGAPSPSQAEKRRSTPVRMETEEAKKKRIAEEEEKAKKKEMDKEKEKEELEKKRKAEEAKKLKEEEEKRRAEEEEKKRERVRHEEEKKRKEDEERMRKEDEERVRKENEEKEKERLRLQEEERVRLQKLKQEEEERLRREEEALRLKKVEEEREKERLRKEQEQQEQERIKREEEEKDKERARAIALAAEEAIKIQERIADSQLETVAEVESEKPEDDLSVSVASSPIPTPSPAPSVDSHKRRPIPGPLDLSSTNRLISQPLSSALATARHIQDLGQVAYPEGIKSPKVELNANAKDGRFRYDREFLLQFMDLCKEKPENLPPLDAIGMDTSESSHQMSRGGSSRGRNASAGPSTLNLQRQPSIGLGITGSGKIGGPMGQFATIGKMGDERFGQMRSASSGSMPANLPFGSRPTPLGRTPSQGGPNGVTGSSLGNKRTRSKRGEQRNEANRVNNNAPVAPPNNYNFPVIPGFEPVAPLEQSANRWVANSTKRSVTVDTESPEVVDKKVRALLNKLSMEKFESISNQIIAWANRSEREKDGRTLIQVIRLVFEKATDEANWSEMYARLCRKMMEQISPNVQDETIKNSDGKPIAGGLLFRKYLLNRCQEDFERGWTAKEKTAKAAAEKASEDQAAKEAGEKSDGEAILYSEEYYAAQKAKRQGLGLVKFIGELFKLQMLTERIMHECIKKALSNVDDPEEEEIESLCKLLTTVGLLLDTNKAHAHMDVYFARIRELSKSANVTSRMQFMLQDVIELRERKWIPRSLAAAPSTIAQVHEAAAKEKQEKEAHGRAMSSMSRGGSRRGTERGEAGPQAGADGWTPTARVSTKAGDLSNFGKINKPSTTTMNFAPVNVFSKKDVKGRESHSLSRTNSSANMYSLLEHSGDPAAHSAASASALRVGRPPSRMASIDLTNTGSDFSALVERPKLMLQKRSIPLPPDIKTDVTPVASAPVSASEEEEEEGELKEEDIVTSSVLSMTEAEMDKKIEEDIREFFSIRNIEEAEVYFTSLPDEGRYRLVDKLVMTAIEKKESDAKLVGELFERVAEKGYCTSTGFEQGFMPTAELLDDIAIDAPKAIDLMAFMIKGAKLDDEIKSRIASKSESSERLMSLTTS